jgi:hypothetical protein
VSDANEDMSGSDRDRPEGFRGRRYREREEGSDADRRGVTISEAVHNRRAERSEGVEIGRWWTVSVASVVDGISGVGRRSRSTLEQSVVNGTVGEWVPTADLPPGNGAGVGWAGVAWLACS